MTEPKFVVTDAMIEKATLVADRPGRNKSWYRVFAEEIVRLAATPRKLRRVEVNIVGWRSVEAQADSQIAFTVTNERSEAFSARVNVVQNRVLSALERDNYADATALVDFLRLCHESGPFVEEGEET